ncbi:DUF192 domain-containing protein [Novosphingobium lentum]|uniref:DUF192 domain-containing protein n=1 Tax=Novosphingobium lentum TaxID=145287 RepID=UPI000B1FFDB0|nr:DUF192 domain-containing protein [Novosphingobium lentum]
MNKARTFTLAVLGAVAACSPMAADAGQKATQSAAPTTHPVSGLPVIPLTIAPAGKPHAFRVEVARTEPEQARGLMFRTEMGADEGMIFPMSPPRDAAFWMKNTVIPLDIVFIAPDHRIANIAANAVPYSLAPIPSAGEVMGVLELNGGRAAQLGIKAGDRVDW